MTNATPTLRPRAALMEIRSERKQLGAQLERLASALLPTPGQRPLFQERFSAAGPLGLENLDDRRRRTERAIQNEIKVLREKRAQGAEVEIYRSGAAKSGGQREKLATTGLAAALRYQLGGAEGGFPIYAPVVLDEAFGKADNELTELAMRIFLRFGFEMIVATPLKSVMTLEPFIGGACFVDIVERKRSATLPIEYDSEQQRLRLPAQDHA